MFLETTVNDNAKNLMHEIFESCLFVKLLCTVSSDFDTLLCFQKN